jgi:hypothetical protein
MLCSYRYYVRPERLASRPKRPLTIKREEAGSPPPAPESQSSPVVSDAAPHVGIVQQYAW